MSMKIRVNAQQFWAMRLGHLLLGDAAVKTEDDESMPSIIDAAWHLREREQRQRNTRSYFEWRKKYDAHA